MKYLTIKEKKELVLQGKDVPLCVNEKRSNFRTIIKSRNIFGDIRNKLVKL